MCRHMEGRADGSEERAEARSEGVRDLLHRVNRRGHLSVLELGDEARRETGLGGQASGGEPRLFPKAANMLSDLLLSQGEATRSNGHFIDVT